MSDTIPQSVSNGCRKYVKSRMIVNTFNSFNNVTRSEMYEVIKTYGLQEPFKRYAGKMYSNATTEELKSFMSITLSDEEKKKYNFE